MRILFFGSGEFAVPSLRSIHGDGHAIVSVVTQPDRPGGRGRHSTPTPVKRTAIELGLTVIDCEDVNAAGVVDRLRTLRADLACVVAFGQKIGPELLAAFPVGIVNLHASLLPALRGAAPIQWAILNGAADTGVSVFRLVEKMDAGPVLVQRRTAIGIDETADELHDRLARIGCDAMRATIELLARDPSTPGMPQDPAKVTHAPKLSKADGRIRFDQPVAVLARRICGLWSWPAAACQFVSADRRCREEVLLARAVRYEGRTKPARSADETGVVTEVMSVQVADGELMLLELKPAGGRLMTWQDFVNGRHVRPGDRFVALEG